LYAKNRQRKKTTTQIHDLLRNKKEKKSINIKKV